MKTKNSLLFIGVAVLFLISLGSCKKDVLTRTENQIKGKWFVVKREIKSNQNGQVYSHTYPVTPADYFTFKEEGKYVSSFDRVVSSGSYQVLNDRQIIVNNDTAAIIKITKDEFQFHFRIQGVEGLQETWLSLEK